MRLWVVVDATNVADGDDGSGKSPQTRTLPAMTPDGVFVISHEIHPRTGRDLLHLTVNGTDELLGMLNCYYHAAA